MPTDRAGVQPRPQPKSAYTDFGSASEITYIVSGMALNSIHSVAHGL